MASPFHDDGCAWEAERERCTCRKLYPAKAYRFRHGGIIVFDQHGHQMPYYQDWNEGAARMARDWPEVDIRPGEVVR